MLAQIFNVFIFLAHILLLYWMIYILKHAGFLNGEKVLLHFAGISIFGASLIFISAKGIKYFHLKKIKSKHAR